MLSCKNKIRGYKKYRCPDCSYVYIVVHTCKSRFCSSCGKKATEQWIEKNFECLPKTSWQHITFTMPDIFWDLFWLNRELFGCVSTIAAGVVQDLAKKKNILPGIFAVLHSFGRDMKRNVHIHLSTTTGGLTLDYKKWKKITFHYVSLMKMWRTRIIQMFRKAFLAGKLKLPKTLKHLIRYEDFNRMLNEYYSISWNVHAAKPNKDHAKNVNYLARYLKRPPMADTRIEQYDGTSVTFNFLDHHTGEHDRLTLPVFDFIKKLIQHIPDKHFRLIRYYGWLSNRTRTKLLPIVRKLLDLPALIKKTVVSFCSLMMKEFYYDPLMCPFCKISLELACIVNAESTDEILQNHKKLALPAGTLM